MNAHILILFIGVIWYPTGTPELHVVETVSIAKCESMADTFELAMINSNAMVLPPFRDAFSDHCEAVVYSRKDNA